MGYIQWNTTQPQKRMKFCHMQQHGQTWGFPGGTVIKNLPANAGDMGSTPRSRRSPGEENGNPISILAWKIPWTEEPGR